MQLLSVVFAGNPLNAWAKALGTAVGVYILVKVIRTVLVNRLRVIAKRTKRSIDNIILEVIVQTQDLLIILTGIYAGLHFLTIPGKTLNIIDKVFFIVIALQVGYWLGGFINHLVLFREKRESGNKEEQTAVHAFGLFGKIVIWTVVALVTIQNVSGMKAWPCRTSSRTFSPPCPYFWTNLSWWAITSRSATRAARSRISA